MKLILHNLKVALRNLMKYKLQTLINVLSIAVGIVTFSLTHSMMSGFRLPFIFDESYCDRAYEVTFKTILNGEEADISTDIIQVLKGNGGLINAEKFAIPNFAAINLKSEFQLKDSSIRKGDIPSIYMDPAYPDYAGIKSSVSGRNIRNLKVGEAIISEKFAKRIFGNLNPIGVLIKLNFADLGSSNSLTIVDVFQTPSIYEPVIHNDCLYYCDTEDLTEASQFFPECINVVIKEGSSEQQLKREIEERILPMGVKAELTRVVDRPDFKRIIPVKMIVYVIGSLILLAAVLGFLRIESQLFRIRRREMALRIANGGSRMQIFSCLVTEVALTICISILLSLVLGGLLQNYLDEKLNLGIDSSFLKGLLEDTRLIGFSILTGAALIALCSIIAWCMLLQISRERQGLEMSIRRKNTHLMRNAMLGIQIIISMVFVCSAFILLKGGDWILKVCNVPENDSRYSECLYMDFREASDYNRMIEEIKRLPDLEKMIGCPNGATFIQEIFQNPDIMEKLNGRLGYRCYFTEDTTFLSFLGIEVEWLRRDINSNEYMLIGEKAFKRFNEIGLLDNMALTLWNYSNAMPVAGIIKKFPYDMYGESLVIIGSDPHQVLSTAILVPKEGKGKTLWKSVETVIERLEPELINTIVHSYRERENILPLTVEIARTGGWILGGISIIICAMSILSTIALDTRARRKEVAIRKVNGAKSKNIYRMFGRVYTLLIIISLFITIPICILFNRWVENYINDSVPKSIHLSPVGPLILGITIVILLIITIVGWQIHRVMQVNPAKIIAKE